MSVRAVKEQHWRKVVSGDYIANTGGGFCGIGGSWHLKLDCGHEAFRKASQKYPERVKCRECAKRAWVAEYLAKERDDLP